ncbi:TonB-dependent receptor [Lacibacter luteus]|uniref:TonB-dependent receptor n=1 Tax=Lacibacter luteus TaxID=2508719 RepID=A0A4Q1CGW6_9BACT|nr:TonB-dependent receptor [Lacibacter luteus]RXK59362.1 TonB-dependent receptor [Lacibacter luteus]
MRRFNQRSLFFGALPVFLIFFFSMLSIVVQAQQRQIAGTVKDAKGAAVTSVSVVIKGGNASTITAEDGSFKISAKTGDVLVLSAVSFETAEVKITASSSYDVVLTSSSVALTDVVVVGYGTQRKKDVTGAVKSLKAESFNKGIITSPQQLLQGKVSGVNVTSVSGEPGVQQGITIRGPGGVRTSNTPLFVVDGIPLDNNLTGRGDPLNFLNPQDIESMDVLKDASATAIYGSRGANGVVIITTKKGKAGASQLSFSSSLGISKIARKLPVFTAAEFRSEVPKTGATIDDKGASTDWQDEIFRTGITQDYNLSLSGGAEKLTYFGSFGMQKQEGIIKKNNLNRYSGRFNASQKFWNDRLVIDVNLAVNQTKNDRPFFSAILGQAISNNPTYPARDANGNPVFVAGVNNPLFSIDGEGEMSTINRVIGSISPSLTIVKGLVYKLNFGIDNSNGTNDIQSKPSVTPFREGRLETFYNYNRNRLIENYLTYNWVKNPHNVSALAGHSYQRIFLQGRNYSINRFTAGGVEPQYNPGTGQLLDLATNRPGGFAVINELQSFFGRLTYQYNSKYLATVNFRADGSTKFGENNKYGYFPSFSLGWKITEEDFMRNSIFSNLKLRAGWGITGNQELPEKQTQPLFTSSTAGNQSYPLYPSGTYPAGTIYVRLANPNLQWETSTQIDVGLDFSLRNAGLSGTIDYFRKVTNNILLAVPPADPIVPASTVWTNVEDMNIINQGVELELDYRHSGKNVSYNVGGNVTFIKNKVENSPYTVITTGLAAGAGLTSSPLNGYINGEPIGTFYLNRWDGIGANGQSVYFDKDKNGSTYTDNDRIAAGTALPNIIYSFYGGVNVKGFDFNFNMNGVSGNKVYDLTANSTFTKVNLSRSGNVTAEAVAAANESSSNAAPISTRYLKNGAFLRMNNMSLGYNVNTSKLGVSKWVSNLRVYVTGQNLFVITDYNGYDPEVNTDRNSGGVISYGIDYLSYPKAKSFIFGLNLSF